MTISLGFLVVLVAGVVIFALFFRHVLKETRESTQKDEALFASMFPDLQPYYHPENILEFVRARLAQAPAAGGMRVPNPPGFDVPAAEVALQEVKGELREIWRLLDATGQELSQFMFDTDEKDGMVRVGQGKFRVSRVEDRVRYWHPDREFKWVDGEWKFVTRMAETPFQSDDRGSLTFGDSSSSSSARTAAAVAGVAAAGGAFDGGGASTSFDGRAGGGSDFAGSEASAAGSTSY